MNRLTMTLPALALIVLGPQLLSQPAPAGNPLDDDAREWVENTFSSMSLPQKVGQLIIGAATTRYTSVTSDEFHRIQREISEFHLGGYHAFRGEVLSAAQLIRRMQESAQVPLFITADLEGGTGLIFKGGTRFPRAMALGATGDPDAVRRVARITAREARRIGINVNFYPVVDVNNNPENPIINIRSFGEDPEAVARLSAAYISSLQANGMLATAKHFPGHGDTATDSHLDLPVIEASRERLERVELVPFRWAVDAGVSAVMTAHISVPALEPGKELPATLSKRILGDLLRDDMGFEGLIITDALNMKGIADRYSDGDASVRAFQAGADLLLFPRSISKAHQGLLQAARAGKISTRRLDASVRRILEYKARLGLHRYQPGELERLDEFVGSKEHQEAAQEIMSSAVTVVKDDRSVLPLKLQSNGTVLILTMLDQRRRSEERGDALIREFRRRHRRVIHFEIGADATSNEIAMAGALARRVSVVLVGAYVRVAASKGSIALSQNQLRLLETLSTLKRPFVLALFGSPYLLHAVPDLPSYVVAYDDYPGAELAVVRAILGETSVRGRLPVGLPDLFPVGHGIQ